MAATTRRQILGTALAGVGLGLAEKGAAIAATPAGGRTVASLVSVGKTGVQASFLAQGTGVNGGGRASDHTRMGLPAFEKLLRHSLDRGIRFLDMADSYGTHEYVKRTLKPVPRERVTLLSKVWPKSTHWNNASPDGRAEVDRIRKELSTDYLDVCLLHCMLDANWAKDFARQRDGLAEQKSKGAVRALGVSCHDHGALKVAASDPWVDVIFARINHKGGSEYSCDDTASAIAETLKTARRNGKFVVGMKIFGAGKLTSPADKDASLAFVIGNDLVDAMTIGTVSPQETDDTIARVNKALRARG